MQNLYNYLQNTTSHLLILEWESNQYVFLQVLRRTNTCIWNDVKLYLAWIGNYDTSSRIMNTKVIKKLFFLSFFKMRIINIVDDKLKIVIMFLNIMVSHKLFPKD